MVNNTSKLERIGEKENPSLRRVYKNNTVMLWLSTLPFLIGTKPFLP